ncbi:hypothetical protein PG993_000422 [Apiospora rasikravindrae]|uniref:Oxidoreductase AflY n=1 Tax=Apiospora rasikravindrae TaxID=990691 RepID=A0ABR1U8I9_9PEZI
MWDLNAPYQKSTTEECRIAQAKDSDLADPDVFARCLGQDSHYPRFLVFFTREIAEKGIPSVVNEYVLKGDERANSIYCRLYADLVHPMIHLGCGLEFNQPSIVAEALAAACVHDDWPRKFLLPTEDFVRQSSPQPPPSAPLLDVLEAMRRDPVISQGVQDGDPFNKIPDAFLQRVSSDQLVPHLARFQVAPRPDDIQRKLSEVLHTVAYVLGAAQRPGRREAVDFVMLHGATLGVFYPAMMAIDWISDRDKARLLESMARVDAVLYAGCRTPALYPARVAGYAPRHPGDGWPQLIHRSVVYRDEGHLAKLMRALFGLEQLGEPGVDMPLAKDQFVKIAHMAMDTAEQAFEPDGHTMPAGVSEAIERDIGPGGEMVTDNMKRFVFYGGLEKAWDYIPRLDGRPK